MDSVTLTSKSLLLGGARLAPESSGYGGALFGRGVSTERWGISLLGHGVSLYGGDDDI